MASANISSRKRMTAALEHRCQDRIPMLETLYWPRTLRRWHKEGLPENADPIEYFQLDRFENYFGVFDCTPRFKPKIIEENSSFTIIKNKYGAIVKQPKKEFEQPTMLEPAIKNSRDWDKIKKRLNPDQKRFTGIQTVKNARSCQRAGGFVTIETIEPLWFLIHNTMGYELALTAMINDAELVKDIIRTYTTFSIRMLEITFQQGFTADALFFFSDICCNSGMLFSPKIFKKLAAPSLARFKELCDRHNMYFLWHCDGCVPELIPLLIDLGVHAVHPLEARAGNDVREYKETFGHKICLIGNINADIVAQGRKKQIEKEVAQKIIPAKENGGYIYHIDHSVPPTVSLDSYRFLIEMVRKYGRY